MTKEFQICSYRDFLHNYLFKKDIPAAFLAINNKQFMGIIKGVTQFGKLRIMLEDDSIQEFNIKEIKMLY